jgi:signal transduction histidine kinase
VRTFSQRLTLRFAALVAVTSALVLAGGGWLLDRELRRNLELLHGTEHAELRLLLGSGPPLTAAETARRIARDAENDATLFLVQVRDPSGRVLFRSRNLGAAELPPLPAGVAHGAVELPGVGPLFVSEFPGEGWRLAIASSLGIVDGLLWDYARISLLLLGGVAAVGLGLGHAFSRVTLRPLRLIAETANRIRSDNLSERIPAPEGRDELATLVRLLNQMFDRLQAAFEQVGRFAADVSHEVKTPLSLIRLNAERLRGRVGADPEAAAAVADILEEIERINHVADRLLFLARAESGALQCTLRPAAVGSVLGPLAEDAQVLASDRGVRLAVEAGSDGEIRADPGLLRQLLLNVLSNAISVTPAGGLVRLRSGPIEGGWRFEVLDEGPGLPPEQLARLFERFVRFDPRGSGPRPGHGLGLAISRSIAQLHGGSIRALARDDRSGLRIEVDLPA